LCRQGFLGVGAKESLRFSSAAEGFLNFVAEERIYQKRAELCGP
jgi:chemotaxis protein methyltransferase CheR